ncbi:MAG: phage portal protein [Clostridia bacterium]|nr:phage portal protein [Clostridia bacterium]
MGLFEKIFPRRRQPTESGGVFETFTAYAPAMNTWNGQLYEAAQIRAAIDARSRHISKLRIVVEGSAKPKLQTRLRHAPNEFQTWPQFLYRLNTIRDMQNTAFIVPVYDVNGEKTGIFPILPSRCELVEYNGVPWLRYEFASGKKAAVPLAEVGIMTKFQYRDDLFGENNRALDETMELLGVQSKGIAEAVKNSNTFRFMAKKNNFASPEDLAKERQAFNRTNLEAEGGGMLLFPNTYTDIRQIEAKPYTVDPKTMEIIRTNVFYYFGVNEKILMNLANGDEWASFYEGCVEEFAVQLSEVLSRMLFSPLERSNGSRVYATANRLQYMSNADKISVSKEMGDRGQLMLDEIREIWNLPPLPNGMGRYITLRGEYYMIAEDGTIVKKADPKRDGTREEEQNATEQ